MGLVFAEPYIPELNNVEPLEPGGHKLSITAFGICFNGFGHLYLSPGKRQWCGPLLWRTDDDLWTSEYAVQPVGVLQNTVLVERGKPKVASWKEGPAY